ncbi:MAG: formate/nitrite transporter family protein [Burkholderiaceae bacterium]|nr:formate/nitrite transporter family protein [Burkholderiaceae bacterium]
MAERDSDTGKPTGSSARRFGSDTSEQARGTGLATPSAQHLDAREAIQAIAMSSGRRLLEASLAHVAVMAAYAGALIAAGALFSVLLSAGVETQGLRRLLEGLGFTAGFFFVILSQAALFTEINVVMPITLLHFSKLTLLAKATRF